jgi:xanthine/uracil permease
MVSGVFGVIGPVNYSLSPGVIYATGCASRFPLLPCSVIIILLSFLPALIGFMGSIPSVVVGSVLLYLMSAQIAAGLIVAFKEAREKDFDLENGLIIGAPVLLGTIFSFLPPDVIHSLPVVLKPILGNGFVVGVITVFIMEHLIYRRGHADPATN